VKNVGRNGISPHYTSEPPFFVLPDKSVLRAKLVSLYMGNFYAKNKRGDILLEKVNGKANGWWHRRGFGRGDVPLPPPPTQR